MKFIPTPIHDTVLAYQVIGDNDKPLGQVWLHDLYWHALPKGGGESGDEQLRGNPDFSGKRVQGGPGFVPGRGYETKDAAGNALVAAATARSAR